jgi:hypothetical protein
MWTFFEVKNQRKAIARLGAKDHGILETEKLIHLNSYAHRLAYPIEALPYKDVTSPSDDKHDEYMGFSYHLPSNLHDVSNPTVAAAANNAYDSDDDYSTTVRYMSRRRLCYMFRRW